MSGHSERIWRCTCGGSHFVAVAGFGDEPYVYLKEERDDRS